MAETITVNAGGAPRVIVAQSPAVSTVTDARPGEIAVTGSPTPGANYLVGDYTPEEVEGTGTSFLIQTGLGPNGDDFTIWIEDSAWD